MNETVWYKCRKCSSTTNALPGSKMYESIGSCYAGGNCDREIELSHKQENEALKARILRLEERIAELTRNQ